MERIRIGMNYETVRKILGEPIFKNSGSEILDAKDVFASTETRSGLFFTEFIEWKRPEGDYNLVFESGILKRIFKAPDGFTDKVNEDDITLALIIIIVFAEQPKDIKEESSKVFKNLKIQLVENALVECYINKNIAIDSTYNDCMTFLIVRLLNLLEKSNISQDEVDMDQNILKHFRTSSDSNSWNAGVVFLVPNPDKKEKIINEDIVNKDYLKKLYEHHLSRAIKGLPIRSESEWAINYINKLIENDLDMICNIVSVELAKTYHDKEVHHWDISNPDTFISVSVFPNSIEITKENYYSRGYLNFLKEVINEIYLDNIPYTYMHFQVFLHDESFKVTFTLIPHKQISIVKILPIDLLTLDEQRKVGLAK